MGAAKVIALHVQPLRTAQLCYDGGGSWARSASNSATASQHSISTSSMRSYAGRLCAQRMHPVSAMMSRRPLST